MERASLAFGGSPFAVTFSGFDQKSVKLVEQRFVVRQMAMQELLRIGVVTERRDQIVALQDAARVSISDKERLFPRVEQDGIHGFRPQAPQGKKLVSKPVRRPGKEFA